MAYWAGHFWGSKRSSHLGGRDLRFWLGGATVQLGSGDSLTLLSSWLGTRLPCSQSQLRTPFLQEALLTSWPTTVTSSRASPPSPPSQPWVALSGCRWGPSDGSSWAPSSSPVAWPHPEPKADVVGLWLPQTTAGCEVCRSLSQGAGAGKGKQEGQWEGNHLSLGLESAGDRAAEGPEDREAGGKRAVEGGCRRAKWGSHGVGIRRTLSPHYVGHSVCPRVCMSLSLAFRLGVLLCDNSGWQALTQGPGCYIKRPQDWWDPE